MTRAARSQQAVKGLEVEGLGRTYVQAGKRLEILTDGDRFAATDA